jgi:hypothetical protein
MPKTNLPEFKFESSTTWRYIDHPEKGMWAGNQKAIICFGTLHSIHDIPSGDLVNVINEALTKSNHAYEQYLSVDRKKVRHPMNAAPVFEKLSDMLDEKNHVNVTATSLVFTFEDKAVRLLIDREHQVVYAMSELYYHQLEACDFSYSAKHEAFIAYYGVHRLFPVAVILAVDLPRFTKQENLLLDLREVANCIHLTPTSDVVIA